MEQKRSNTDSLSAQPVLFSKRVKASLVDTLLSPEQTNSAMIAATVVPTDDGLGSGIHGGKDLPLAIKNDIEEIETREDTSGS
jgi:hypothetical protein